MLAQVDFHVKDTRVGRDGFRPFPKPVEQDEPVVLDDVYSDADLVPEDFQNRLMNLRDMMTACSWGIGDIANGLVEEDAASGMRVTAKRIYKAVGRFCGRSGRTVRYYAETASFYPPDVRNEYEMLSFAHFVFARQVGETWREVLDYAAALPGATVEQLKVKYGQCQKTDTEEPETEQMREVSRIMESADNLMVASAVADGRWKNFNPHPEPTSKHTLISAVSSLVSALEEYKRQLHKYFTNEEAYRSILASNDDLIKKTSETARAVAQTVSSLD